MSNFADSSKAYVWLDGDSFCVPAGTELPADPWAEDLTGWDPYGGIEGTTSSYAEKSLVTHTSRADRRNYLRIRGEEAPVENQGEGCVELPPHTRRRAMAATLAGLPTGTTSAYAEKSSGRTNHPEPRGELPPHTRRRACPDGFPGAWQGTTSAYAEKRVGWLG